MKSINQYSAKEIREMKELHIQGKIDYCPRCKTYHHKKNKPIWPISNMWLCEKCQSLEDWQNEINRKVKEDI